MIRVLIAALAVAGIIIAVGFFQIRALRADVKFEQQRNANLVDELGRSEAELKQARKDYERLDSILTERDQNIGSITRQYERLRREISDAIAAADSRVRECVAVRLPDSIAGRLRKQAGDGDQNGVRPAAGGAGAGLRGTGPGN